MKFSLDKEKAIDLANKLEISVKFNSTNPGVTILNEENHTRLGFEDFFPELENENFITKDKKVFRGETITKISSTIVIELSSETGISIPNSSKFNGAA